MQLVSNDRRTEDSSETEPILHQSNIVQRSEEASFEIRTVSRDCSLSADDSQTIDVDENCNLVNADQPQCRICLDIGGEDLIAPCHCKGTQKRGLLLLTAQSAGQCSYYVQMFLRTAGG
ncbi:RING/FYVE/PHD zinc finger superfamily protein [Actinidia rufa]|uniref:RING/FYVE/PHD zinc finger superfamily protein n=1 Tax=Actinidia rufa TaxID=165716 RepID=A0A7J0GBL0_9ERIC|nr:RING/FYVE/PHD zinc finger superfamily protein [Actinidia rufa]